MQTYEGGGKYFIQRRTQHILFYGFLVKDHSDSEIGNPLPPHGRLFPINSKGSLYAPSHIQDSTCHGLVSMDGWMHHTDIQTIIRNIM